MKCTKCGYISFDYNQVCPRCNKKLGVDYEKFYLPSFRPDPPSLLGFLIGEANESHHNLRVQSAADMEDIRLSNSVILNRDDLNLDQEDLDISFEPEDSEEYPFDQEPVVENDQVLSDSDFSLEEKEDEIVGLTEEEEGEDMSFDLGELAIEEDEEVLDKPDDMEMTPEKADEDQDYDTGASLESLESMPADTDTGMEDEIESEIELDLDDLKLSDMGDLEIGVDVDMEPSDEELDVTLVDYKKDALDEEIESEANALEALEKEEEKLPDISDLMLGEEELITDEEAMILDESSSVDSGPVEKEEAFELGDVQLSNSYVEEEESMDLEGFDLGDEGLPGDSEGTLILDDLSVDDSAELEKSFDINDISIDEASMKDDAESDSGEYLADSDEIEIDLDAMSVDVDEYQKGADSDDEDFELELEDMDIDLDLDEPKK